MEPQMDITLGRSELGALLANPLLTGILDEVSDGAVVIDARTRSVLAMNRRARQLLGVAEGEAIGARCKSALNSPLCAASCLLNAAAEGGAEPDVDHFYRGPAGDRLVHANTRMILVRGPDGAPLAGVELFRDLTETRRLERELGLRRSFHGIIGGSPGMQRLYDLIEQVAPYDLPVLITGESGVGKERFADAVVALSERARGPFVKVNCAALNPSLIESELFGHKKGAYTGAAADRRGSFEEADGGTLLLDEIGELPLSLQAKLLRVLQQGEVQRVGEDRPRIVDVRVIGATNRDIEADAGQGHFREDLYYRLAGVRLHVPPLRDRRVDIPALAEHFLHRFSADAARRGRPKDPPPLSPAALDALMAREWRGNVRELENVLRLAWIRTPAGGTLGPEQLEPPAAAPSAEPDPVSLAEVERRAIERAMQRSDGNMAAAARLLGIDRTTLWRKLKRD
jgi:transcriptional regulator with PAS, ATPase and Fis domain